MSILQVTALESGYFGTHIVRGVSLHVEPGEIVALIGPNGAGKSTLLTTLSGLLKPREGQVLLQGQNIAGMDPERVMMQGLAYVPQVGNIFPSLTVMETLEICYKGNNFQTALEEMLELFPRLKQKLHTRSGLMSGGERQMCAIARALINRPFHLVMMDEPSAGLSVGNVKAIFERVQWIRDNGMTVLLVEQNAAKALEIADRAYIMESGRIALEDSAKALLNSPAVREHYLGIRP